MYTLIQYDSGEMDILQSKRVKLIKGDECSVRCPGGGAWRAVRLASRTQMAMICEKKRVDREQAINDSYEVLDKEEDHAIESTKRVTKRKANSTGNKSNETNDNRQLPSVKGRKKKITLTIDQQSVVEAPAHVEIPTSSESNNIILPKSDGHREETEGHSLNKTFTVEDQSQMTFNVKKELIEEILQEESNSENCNLLQIANNTLQEKNIVITLDAEDHLLGISNVIEQMDSSAAPSNITEILAILDPALLDPTPQSTNILVNYSITSSECDDANVGMSSGNVLTSNSIDVITPQTIEKQKESVGDGLNDDLDLQESVNHQDDSTVSTEIPQTSTPVRTTKSVRFSERISDILPVSTSLNEDTHDLTISDNQPTGPHLSTSMIDTAAVEQKSQLSDDEEECVPDDNELDPDYIPSSSAISTKLSSISKSITINNNNELVQRGTAIDVRSVIIPTSDKTSIKKHFCPYCHTLQTQFPRHLTLKHSDEADVQKFIHLPAKCPERKKIIEIIRNVGNFNHDTDMELNTGILIVKRRRQEMYERDAEDYIPCTSCKGFFSKETLRIHFSQCNENHKKGVTEITVAGRQLTGYIDAFASPVLRDVIFLVLRDDPVSRCIKYDRFIILYANKLCEKYTLDHQHDMIRSILRLIGRFKLSIKKNDKRVTDFDSIFYPPFYNAALDALRDVAHWNPTTQAFKTPAVAQHLSTLMRKMCKKCVAESIKDINEEKEKMAEKFLKLWDEEIPFLITKKAMDNQIDNQRRKKIVLPSTKDIKSLYCYVKDQAKLTYDILVEKFNWNAWKLLNESVLILLLIFNRRRAGEIERLKLDNYYNKQDIDDFLDAGAVANLSNTSRDFAKLYKRITLTGKLNRTVSILLSSIIIQFIDTLLSYRDEAQVNENNDYLFAVPNTNPLKKKYIRACPLMRRFSVECGAFMPSSLRGTLLRKHVATHTAALDVGEGQVTRLANFLGHEKEIHKNIYRVSIPANEITHVSKLLINAMGGDDAGLTSDEEDKAMTKGVVDEDDNESDQNSDSSEDDEDYRPQLAIQPSSKNTRMREAEMTSNDESKNDDSIRHQTPVSNPAKKTERANIHHASKNTKKVVKSQANSGRIVRQTWSVEEKQAVKTSFGNVLTLTNLPSLIDCQNAIQSHSVLKNRTAEQLKSWIDNQRRAANRKNEYALKKSWC